MPARVAINGLGRIGRATLKIVHETPELELVAVNDMVPVDNLVYLLRYDTVYGRYERQVEHEANELLVAGKRYQVFREKDPAKLPWGEMGVDLVFECTGVFRRKDDLEKHLQAGAGKVLLSAAAKGDGVPFVVYGVNQSDGERIISCTSCTTNCVAPVIEIFGRRIGLRKAIMTTVHAYTVSQTVVDSSADEWRRGRAAAANFIPTTTGAARATTKALPQYEGRFDGVAVRGPVAAGSLADITIVAERATSVDEINAVFEEEARSDRYHGVLGVVSDPIVSSDTIKDPRCSIVDLSMTQVVDDDLVKIMSWYDNEWGYAAQMVREGLRVIAR